MSKKSLLSPTARSIVLGVLWRVVLIGLCAYTFIDYWPILFCGVTPETYIAIFATSFIAALIIVCVSGFAIYLQDFQRNGKWGLFRSSMASWGAGLVCFSLFACGGTIASSFQIDNAWRYATADGISEELKLYRTEYDKETGQTTFIFYNEDIDIGYRFRTVSQTDNEDDSSGESVREVARLSNKPIRIEKAQSSSGEDCFVVCLPIEYRADFPNGVATHAPFLLMFTLGKLILLLIEFVICIGICSIGIWSISRRRSANKGAEEPLR